MADTEKSQAANHGIGRGAMAGSVGIMAGRVAGLVRDVVFARYLGTGTAFAAFLLAFTLPNLMRRFLGEGALTEAFVPLLNERLSRDGREQAFDLVNRVLSWVCGVTGLAVGVLAIVAWFLRPLVADNELWHTTLTLAPALLPYAIMICLAAEIGAVLNSFGRFALPAWGAVWLNIAFVAAVFGLVPYLDTPVWALVAAVLAAGVVQLGALIPGLMRLGWRPRWYSDWRSPELRELLALMTPGLLGAAVYQINVVCDRLFAGWVGDWAVTSLYYSERLIYLPVGVFAVALSAAALPVMSRAWASDDPEGLQRALAYSMRHVLFLSCPCVLGLMILAEPIITLFFVRGAFGPESMVATRDALLFYAPGIPAFAALKIVRGSFYARKDMKTPVRVSIFCMILNVALNALLVSHLQQRGLALATAVSSLLNVAILTWLLARALPLPAGVRTELIASALRQLLALAAAAAAMIAVSHALPTADALVTRLIAVFLPLAAGAAAYLLTAFIARSAELRELLAALRKRRG